MAEVWYKANRTWHRITAHRVLRSTRHYLVFASARKNGREYKVGKEGTWEQWFPTYQEAADHIVRLCERRLEQARSDVKSCVGNLALARKLRKAKPPEPTD